MRRSRAPATAADEALRHARRDPALAYSFWLLTQVPPAARAANFDEAVEGLGLRLGSEPTLMDVVGAVSEAVDRATSGMSGRTDLGEMARRTAAESLATVTGAVAVAPNVLDRGFEAPAPNRKWIADF